MTSEIKKEIFSWIRMLIMALAAAFLLNNFVIVNATVPTGSMENTIMIKDRIVALRWSYLFGDPKRGDIIVFKYPDDEEWLYVKRVIGLPGEKIEIADGRVYIDDSDAPLDEPYLREEPYKYNGSFVVPEGHYFMMGDNRNSSHDSRDWTNTYLERSKILGRAAFKYFPNVKVLK